MTLIAARFVDANRGSPIEYFGAAAHHVTLRLADHSLWQIPARQFRELGPLNWAHREECYA